MVLSAKTEAEMSLDASNTSTTTVSLNYSKNSIQSPVVPVSPKVLSTSILVQAAIFNMKLLPLVRDSVKVTHLTHFMVMSAPKVFPARLFYRPTMPKQQTHTSSTMIKILKYLGQCNGIRADLMLIFLTELSTLVNDTYNEPEEIGLAKPFSLTDESASNVITQNSGEAALSYHQDLILSQT
ncbi:hypothetical protein ACTXT7_010482 [Hymenolepis weldensis]